LRETHGTAHHRAKRPELSTDYYVTRGYGCLDGEHESQSDLTITFSIQPARGILET
jgi:hypothetical protein